MAARGSKSAQQRTEAERARLHTARKEWHDGRIRRRVRDNTIAAIAAVVIIGGAVVSQTVHAQVTAPEPTPEPTPSVEPTGLPSPEDTTPPEPLPTETPAE